ncbi:nudix hydrolase 4-like [Phalaenopsis equestris]|uniref:nudix hydrolase 4-like n=1 Tax=Phalaenopsis equestris TaxID=78828 RepID=UPI0009E29080|nr:nudix hydrolase 4-like [Phalaenopsis equestris]
MMFRKGGWESDEIVKQVSLREAVEKLACKERLGKWQYRSSTQAIKESLMFPLRVTEELLIWPEMSARQRRWQKRGKDANIHG